MRRQNDTGMTLTPLKKDGGRVRNAAADFVPAALTLTGAYGALLRGLGLGGRAWRMAGAACGLLLLAVCIWLLPKDSWTAISLAAAALAAAAFCVIFFRAGAQCGCTAAQRYTCLSGNAQRQDLSAPCADGKRGRFMGADPGGCAAGRAHLPLRRLTRRMRDLC